MLISSAQHPWVLVFAKQWIKWQNSTRWMTWICSHCIPTVFQFRTLKTAINYLVYNWMTRPENALNVPNVINVFFEAFERPEHSSKSTPQAATCYCNKLSFKFIPNWVDNYNHLSVQLNGIVNTGIGFLLNFYYWNILRFSYFLRVKMLTMEDRDAWLMMHIRKTLWSSTLIT